MFLTYLVSGVVFILILGVLIIVHELGHFFAAKFFKVKVEEFGFGLPPRVFGKKYGETLYSLNAIPAGGFVKLAGEDAEEKSKDPRSFISKSPLIRSLIIVAGVVMNFLLALIAFTVLYMIGGPVDSGEVVIMNVAEDSPAQAAGLKSGDIVIELNGRKLAGVVDLNKTIKEGAGKEISLKVQRENQDREVKLTPRVFPPEGQGPTGISISNYIETKSYPIWEAPIVGTTQAIRITGVMLDGFKNMLVNLVIKREVPKEVGGVVRIGYITHVAAQEGISPLIQWLGLLSLNLAIINALPIPALDGGRLFFTLIEAILRKRVPLKFEKWVHMVGFALLLFLLVVITYSDVVYLVNHTVLGQRFKEFLPFI